MRRLLTSAAELQALINEIGYLPLFAGSIPGFSVQEMTDPAAWFSDDPAIDPWLWRDQLSTAGEVAYGKFFEQKAGFISREFLPSFCNLRRDGYDFDARWDDGLASHRQKKIMDLFPGDEILLGHVIKTEAGFGKDGEKGFEGVMTLLQMQTYLLMRGFQRRTNKRGQPYGMAVRRVSTPEALFGAEHISSSYHEKPLDTRARLIDHCRSLTDATEQQAGKLIGKP